MKDEDIDRLFHVTSQELRAQWEIRNNKGQTLLSVKEERAQALAREEKYGKRETLLFFAMLTTPFAILFIGKWIRGTVEQTPSGVGIPYALMALLACVLFFIGSKHSDKKRKAAAAKVSECDGVFIRFEKSVDALNPLGIFNLDHDVITHEAIAKHAAFLADRVVEAEKTFDEVREDKKVSRAAVIASGKWLKMCDGCYERHAHVAWKTFGICLDRAEIFKAVAAERKKIAVPPVVT